MPNTAKLPAKKSNRGRKSSYNPDLHPIKAKEWLAAGNTKASIAHAFGISTETFYQWANKYSDFADALKTGTKLQENKLVNAMFTSATGFVDGEGKEYAPNTTAGIFLLKNINPNDWRDRRDVVAEVSVEDKSKSDKLDEVLALLRDAG